MRRRTDRELGKVISDLGLAVDVFMTIANALKEKGGELKHLRRIVSDEAVSRMVADLLITDEMRRGFALREDEYLVYVDYSLPHEKEKLEVSFSKGGVSDLFYGHFEWRFHQSCHGMDQTPGDRIFLLKHFDRRIKCEEAIAEMAEQGYRPATHHEAYAFANFQPELQRRFWIFSLGSSTVHKESAMIPVLLEEAGRRVFGSSPKDHAWEPGHRFLFVRKELPAEISRPMDEREFLVQADYDMPRTKDKLESDFSDYGVSEMFYNGKYKWEYHQSCFESEHARSEKTFVVKHFKRPIRSEEAIEEMAAQGYRPATHHEAYAFAQANPELQLRFRIAALGSWVRHGGSCDGALLDHDGEHRVLTVRWFNYQWEPGFRFLFVRKST